MRFVLAGGVSEAEVTHLAVQILKEQNKYDQMASGLIDRLQRIVSLAEKVADEIVCEETEILEKIVPRMFEVMQATVTILCDYVKRGRFGRQSCLVDLEYADGRREDERWPDKPEGQ